MRMTIQEYKKYVKPRHKYNAQKTVIDGIRFDSKAEAEYYLQLKLLQKAGEIVSIELQPEFELLPAEKGKRAVKYVADFLVTYSDGREEIIDVKGVKTAVYRLKKRWVEHKYGIQVKEVKV